MNIERNILQNLSLHPGLMAVAPLWSDVRLDTSCSYSEFKAALETLETKGQAIVIKGEDREKVKITDTGRARLME